jgi:hypothetical protein
VLAATVVGVKITGFNDHDAETILPIQSAIVEPCTTGDACQSDGTCHESDTVTALQAAGYTPEVATAAFHAFAAEFRAAFPGLPIGSQITKVLPPPGSTTLPVTMVDDLIGDATLAPVTVQDNGLTAVGGVDPATIAARTAGTPVGYQTLAYVANNAQCLMGMHAAPDGGNLPCTESLLKMAVDNGITNGASWLELYKQDVLAYPATIADAHAQLVP